MSLFGSVLYWFIEKVGQHSAPLFETYNILNVYDTHNLEVGAFMCQYYKNVLPVSFMHFFSKRSDIHDYHTRNKSDYNTTRNKKAFTDRTVRTMDPILWNSLDETIKKSKTTKHFRSLYKSSLISTYY